MKVNNLKQDSPDYPDALRHIPTPPKELFWIGNQPNKFMKRPRAAVVGSRKATSYGRQVTQQLVGELAQAGVVILSGLALGIDAIAHQAALDAGGLTMAILPTSLDSIYPASHYNLAKNIIDRGGCLLSEYPPGSEVYQANFIARNRLVSGLSDVLLITEAAKNSGTMHTAGFALEQGRTVMAVPGNINSPNSEGCNNLIKKGATPATCARDIFEALHIKLTAQAGKVFRGSLNEQLLYELIKQGIYDQDELATASKLSGSSLSGTLTMLEINGYIKAEAGRWQLS